MRNTIFFLLITGLVFVSCKPDSQEEVFLDQKIKLDAKLLQIDTVGSFDNLILARDFWVYQDSFLIVRNRKYTDVYFIEFYDLNQRKLLKSMFRLGNGPNELLSANVSINNNKLTVIDYVKDQVAFVDIDSVLQNKHYTAFPVRYYPHSPVVAEYNENQLLVENPYCFKDDKLGIDNNAPRFIINDRNHVYVEEKNYEYYTWNVASNGRIITNYSKNRVVYADTNIPVIEIYDSNLRLLRLIHGPDNLPPNYRVESYKNGLNEILFKKGYIPYTYLSFCANDDFFYLVYMGDYLNLVERKNLEDYPMWIFQFDWDGSFKDSFAIGQYISNISLSPDGKSFYATAINSEKNPFLIKLSTK